MSQWKPIETAPKDGTKVFLWAADATEDDDVGGCIAIGLFATPDKFNAHASGKWVNWSAGYDSQFERWDIFYPSHWMPLPERPR